MSSEDLDNKQQQEDFCAAIDAAREILPEDHFLRNGASKHPSKYAREWVEPLVDMETFSDEMRTHIDLLCAFLYEQGKAGNVGSVAWVFSDLVIALGHMPTKMLLVMGAISGGLFSLQEPDE